jgi:Holliday junction resolvasome RuvABC endonuclease subunit
MIITALDMSLVATGWASTNGESGVFCPPKSHDRGVSRLRWLRSSVLDRAVPSDLVVIEGYAYGAKGNAVINLGELGGVIRLALSDDGICYVEVPPACVKLFATGKGNAKKDEVLAAAIRKLEYAGHDHNEADALWLLEMAKRHYVDDLRHQTIAEGRALEKITWPRCLPSTATTREHVG